MKKGYQIKGVEILGIVTIILLGCLTYTGVSVWKKYRDTIVDKQKEQMLIIVDSLSDNIGEMLNNYVEDLFYLESLLINLSPKEKIFREYLNTENKYIANLIFQDEEGKILWCDTQKDFSAVYECLQIQDKKIMLWEGQSADGELDFILSKELSDGKTINLVIDIEKYYENLISDIKLGSNGYVVVKDENGRIIMHPEREQWGREVIDGRMDLYSEKNLDLSSLEGLLEQQKTQEQGVYEYYSYWWINKNLPRVKKISAHKQMKLGEGYLIVSAVMDYQDIYRPVAEGFMSISFTFLGMVAVLAVFLIYFFYLTVQRQKNKKEIAYLKDLNYVLEETRRGEEVIAHQQRLQIMGTMTGGIAHEFNNLLTPIMGYAEMLLDQLPVNSDEYDYAEEILIASEKAKDIIHQISSLSRKNMETVYTFIPAKKMLKRAMKMVHSVCPVNVQIQVEESFKEEGFLGNETQMNQVLLNLCVNAFHAIGAKQDGHLEIEGRVKNRESVSERHQASISKEWKSYIEIIVRDNGCGMEKTVLEQIFNPFFTTKGGKGTGLGLSVVEQIIHSHKGYIFVESEVDKGSEFFIYLPLSEKGRQIPPRREEKTKLAILVVDDNGKIIRLLEKQFKRLGILIDGVSNTEEARKMLEKQFYTVLLIDQNLSRASDDDGGVCFAMSINHQYPDLKKIIMADQIKKEIIEAKQKGFIDAYLEKPVSDSQILEVIRNLEQKGELS